MLTSGKLAGLTAELHPLAKADSASAAQHPTPVSSAPASNPIVDKRTPSAPNLSLTPQPRASTPERRHAGVPHVLLLRVDPSLLLRTGEASREVRKKEAESAVDSIESCFRSLEHDERWADLTKFASKEEMDEVKRLCRLVNPHEWAAVFVAFAEVLLRAQKERSQALRVRDGALDKNWSSEPWYLLDPKYFFTGSGAATSTFDDVGRGLEYVRRLGFENVSMLTHYATDGLGGNGVVAYAPARALGGAQGWSRLLERASAIGVRLCTAAPIGETSIHHNWFERALDGDATSTAYYRRTAGAKRAGVTTRDGQLYARYLLPEGKVIEELVLHPEILPHDHILLADVNGKPVEFHYRGLPWEAQLDLTAPELLKEVFGMLANESNQGVLARWFDGWCAAPVSALLEMFLRLLSPRALWLAGDREEPKVWSKGEVALRESLCLEDREPLEAALAELAELDLPAAPLAWLESPRELELDLCWSPESRNALIKHATARGGATARNGAVLASRITDMLDHDPARVALGLFCLYALPVTPVLYSGTEIGAGNDRAHADATRKQRENYLAVFDAKLAAGMEHDPALMQRGGLAIASFEKRIKERYPAVSLVAALNALRKTHPALAGRKVTAIESSHKGALVWVKENREADAPLLLIANLTGRTARLQFSVAELKHALGSSKNSALQLRDVLAAALGKALPAGAIRLAQGRVFITVPAHGFLALAEEDDATATKKPR